MIFKKQIYVLFIALALLPTHATAMKTQYIDITKKTPQDAVTDLKELFKKNKKPVCLLISLIDLPTHEFKEQIIDAGNLTSVARILKPRYLTSYELKNCKAVGEKIKFDENHYKKNKIIDEEYFHNMLSFNDGETKIYKACLISLKKVMAIEEEKLEEIDLTEKN